MEKQHLRKGYFTFTREYIDRCNFVVSFVNFLSRYQAKFVASIVDPHVHKNCAWDFLRPGHAPQCVVAWARWSDHATSDERCHGGERIKRWRLASWQALRCPPAGAVHSTARVGVSSTPSWRRPQRGTRHRLASSSSAAPYSIGTTKSSSSHTFSRAAVFVPPPPRQPRAALGPRHLCHHATTVMLTGQVIDKRKMGWPVGSNTTCQRNDLWKQIDFVKYECFESFIVKNTQIWVVWSKSNLYDIFLFFFSTQS